MPPKRPRKQAHGVALVYVLSSPWCIIAEFLLLYSKARQESFDDCRSEFVRGVTDLDSCSPFLFQVAILEVLVVIAGFFLLCLRFLVGIELVLEAYRVGQRE
ncbi:hypothetical protein HPP92_018424 [Vanilla planifolia]|uniref:Uncharacterized protein n=1 Tax=Vanilla planifolia TaxID=51239 RepID=A0A835QGS4_VANPL|nr:hypothetical protein HPP92_019037 [Vanilla planifolia]KAG0469096.1 hypothetical protein HPP92_018424 [Vanilla planifolia]